MEKEEIWPKIKFAKLFLNPFYYHSTTTPYKLVAVQFQDQLKKKNKIF